MLGYRTLCSTSLCNCPCFTRRTSSIYISLPVHLKPPRSYWSGLAFRQVSRGLRRHCASRWGGVPAALRVSCNLGCSLWCLHAGFFASWTTRPRRSDSSSFLEWAIWPARRDVGLAGGARVMSAPLASWCYCCLLASCLDRIFLLLECSLLTGPLSCCC